jgi:hypothetical protein
VSGERPAFPTDEDIADAREERLRLDMETAFPARVQSYDSDLQVADLVPLVRRQVPQPDGSHTTEALPVLPCVPVCFPRMGQWFVSFPIEPGDTGLVIVCSGDIGPWRIGSGDVTDPGDLRRHHMSHAVFLPSGLVPRARKLTQTGAAGTSESPALPTGMVIGSDASDGARVMLRADGTIEVRSGGSAPVNVVAGGAVTIQSGLTARVDMQAATQPYVRGTDLADAADRHADAMQAAADAIAAALTAINAWVLGSAVLEALPASAALHGALTTTLSTAMGVFHAATTAWKLERANYLSERIRGS